MAPQLSSHPFSQPSCGSLSPQFDMQRVTLEELKHILYHAFRDHLTMKDIENIIINEEESLNETSGNCQTEFEGGRCTCLGGLPRTSTCPIVTNLRDKKQPCPNA